MTRWLMAVLLLMVSGSLWASDLLMVRSQLAFAEAQPRLEEEINALGYFTANARRVDIDLVGAGFARDAHRSITYGKPDEIKTLSERYPELTPFLPPQIAIIGERGESLLVALNPLYLAEIFPHSELADIFERWHRDLQTILENIRDAR
ncbi:MAG: hypothetical protein L3J26_10800 [Candidatus Polarisedimenticolaceae bacterium]|nr:hypothetical protein [Candidatus Polarisedimenticolaceae bacterium]